MIYLKRTIRNFNKYIDDKNERKYKKKLKVSILKNVTSSNISKNDKSY